MTALCRLLCQVARCSAGSATLEATILAPVAIALMAGSMDFGRAFSASATADKSMRDAARYLARVPASAICGWGLAKAKNLAVYGKLNVSAGDQPLISGWSTTNVTLARPSDCGALPNPTIIQLQATVPFTGLMWGAIGFSNAITMQVQHEERWIGE